MLAPWVNPLRRSHLVTSMTFTRVPAHPRVTPESRIQHRYALTPGLGVLDLTGFTTLLPRLHADGDGTRRASRSAATAPLTSPAGSCSSGELGTQSSPRPCSHGPEGRGGRFPTPVPRNRVRECASLRTATRLAWLGAVRPVRSEQGEDIRPSAPPGASAQGRSRGDSRPALWLFRASAWCPR